MSVMVNQNGLYVPVSDILLPNGNAHENVLDASGNEYFSNRIPLKMRDGNNKVSISQTSYTTSGANKNNRQKITTLDGKFIIINENIGKHLFIEATYYLNNNSAQYTEGYIYIGWESNDGYRQGNIPVSNNKISFGCDNGTFVKTTDIQIPSMDTDIDRYIYVNMYVHLSDQNVQARRSISITLNKMYIK